jgi:hypothetical protein
MNTISHSIEGDRVLCMCLLEWILTCEGRTGKYLTHRFHTTVCNYHKQTCPSEHIAVVLPVSDSPTFNLTLSFCSTGAETCDFPKEAVSLLYGCQSLTSPSFRTEAAAI